jgi:polyhydroxyalkanoate synthesis regulator phasin
MTNPAAKESYEAAILQQLIKNSEDVSVFKNDLAILKEDVAILKSDVAILKEDVAILKEDVAKIQQEFATAKGWLIAIFIGIIVNIFSQPILQLFN